MNTNQPMVYGQRRDIVHVPDGMHPEVGQGVAHMISGYIRTVAKQAGEAGAQNKGLCPGCYMLVAYNALIQLADDNGQGRRELALTMVNAFQALADAAPGDDGWRDKIRIILDPEACDLENCA